MTSPLTLPGISYLRMTPTADAIASDVVLITSKTAMGRSGDERFDIFVNDISNSIGFFGGGAVTAKVLDKAFESGVDQLTHNAARWRHLGKAFALYSVIGSLMFSTPFLRNILTAKRTGKIKFDNMIHEDNQHKQAATSDPEKFNAYIKENKKKFFGSVGVGLGLAAGITVGAMALMRRGTAVPKNALFKWLEKSWTLEKDSFMGIKDWPMFVTWVGAAYAGWIVAARNFTEVRENLVKMANFTGSYFGVKYALQGVLKRFIPSADVQYLVSFGARMAALVGSTKFYQMWTDRIHKEKKQGPEVNDAQESAALVQQNQMKESPLAGAEHDNPFAQTVNRVGETAHSEKSHPILNLLGLGQTSQDVPASVISSPRSSHRSHSVVAPQSFSAMPLPSLNQGYLTDVNQLRGLAFRGDQRPRFSQAQPTPPQNLRFFQQQGFEPVTSFHGEPSDMVMAPHYPQFDGRSTHPQH